jgi:aspartate/methionine/tyrosine aminotransferase
MQPQIHPAMNPNLVRSADAPIVAFKASLPKRDGEVFDMSQAVPSYPTFRPIVEALKQDLDEFSTGFYTPVEGLSELRQAIVSEHPLGGSVGLESRNIFITAGANHAMYSALSALFAPGDTVTLIEPYYFNYDMALSMLGLKADYLRLSPADGFRLNPKSVLAHLEAVKSKGIILITPNNPTGAMYSGDSVLELVEGCARLGVEVLLDETYAAFDPMHLQVVEKPKSQWSVYLGKNLTLIGSFSKAFSLTGYRVGYWAMQHHRLGEALKLQDTMVICASSIGQRAALHGLRQCGDLVRQKTKELGIKVGIIEKWFATPRAFQLKSTGPFFAYVEHPWDGLSARQAATKLYLECGILALPGSVFGSSQERYLRLAYENLSYERLEKALTFLV